MLRLVIDDKIPFIREAAARLGECKFLPGAAISADDVRDADVLITRTRTQVNRALLEGSKVQLVVTATIGHDHIDKDYLAQKGIAWHNCPGCNAHSVAQYVRNSLWIAAAQGCFDEKPPLPLQTQAPTPKFLNIILIRQNLSPHRRHSAAQISAV